MYINSATTQRWHDTRRQCIPYLLKFLFVKTSEAVRQAPVRKQVAFTCRVHWDAPVLSAFELQPTSCVYIGSERLLNRPFQDDDWLAPEG